ncbi:TCR/Tet family MFS transporter [Lentibacter algarum]|uniref:TCR/Tet family MFS transporter n=1 Tax=Lentibacter algarum TaxID=576131 RepID=UPI001C09D5CE|nr:TCR/Tet family MFS transporter [Lentibacter algarum]MBU2983427.1 TCR/Tet family MFS transporter [Lentibacter algarum]
MTNRLPILFIVMTVVIDAMGIGLIMPVMPDLIREVQGGSLANAALWGGILTTAFAVMQFAFSPFIGALSDSFGRRPVLLVSLLVMAADYVVMALAGSIWLLLVGRIVGGITAATHSTAMAYMADISAPHEKAARFGLIGAGFGIGFVLGPVLGGLLAEYGTRAPFLAAAALAFGNTILGALVLRETVTDRTRRRFEFKRANPFGALRSISGFHGLSALLTVYFFFQVAHYVYPAIWAYFVTERFGWEARMIGISLGIYGVFFALVQGFLVKPSIAYLGERRAVITGLVVDIVSLIFLGFVTNGAVLLALIPLFSFGAISVPALQGMMSRNVADNAQGELQGVMGSLSSLSMILSPLLFTGMFFYFTRAGTPLYLPGAPFLAAALIMTVSLMLFLGRKRGNVQNPT